MRTQENVGSCINACIFKVFPCSKHTGKNIAYMRIVFCAIFSLH